MPPVLPDASVNDILEVRINGTLYDQRIMTVLHYEVQIAGSPEDWWTLYLGVYSQLTDPSTGLIPKTLDQQIASLSCDFVDLQVVRPQRLIYRRFVNGSSGAIAEPLGGTTANYAMSITKRGEIPAKGNSGRVQLAGLPPTQYVSGKWKSAFITIIDTDVVPYYLGNITASGYTLQPVFIGKSKTGVLKTNTVIDMVVQDTVRTMHRRTVRLGI